jgi:hypothetical protein
MCIVLNEIDLESLKFVSLFDRFNIIIRHKRSALYGKLIAKQQNETTFWYRNIPQNRSFLEGISLDKIISDS